MQTITKEIQTAREENGYYHITFSDGETLLTPISRAGSILSPERLVDVRRIVEEWE